MHLFHTLIIYRPPTNHLPTTYRPPTDHLLTTYWPLTDPLPTTYRPSTNHLPTTYRPLTDHLPTTYQPPTDHLPTTYWPLTYHLLNTYRPLTPFTNHFFTVQLVHDYPGSEFQSVIVLALKLSLYMLLLLPKLIHFLGCIVLPCQSLFGFCMGWGS